MLDPRSHNLSSVLSTVGLEVWIKTMVRIHLVTMTLASLANHNSWSPPLTGRNEKKKKKTRYISDETKQQALFFFFLSSSWSKPKASQGCLNASQCNYVWGKYVNFLNFVKKNLCFEQLNKFTYHLEHTLNQIVLNKAQSECRHSRNTFQKTTCNSLIQAFPHAGQYVWQNNVILGRL